ncbi:MAG: hypothetical protein CMC40_01600 [Flavobacteriaceae bacterium]|jgi:hypothetical protein|nr:hypothetical protein [Flavobacteriaceae bacterium]
MHYFEFAKRDATIYSGGTTSSINTGLDEILEINKVVSNNGTVANVSRILIDFDLSFISQSIIDSKIPTTAKYYLNLYDATSEEVEAEQNIFVYMVSGSAWKQGTGKLDHDPVTQDGVSYQYRDHENKTPWVTGSVLTDGGAWWTGSQGGANKVSASYQITFDRKDLRVDVTDLVKNHIFSSSLFPNRGFLVKRESLYTGSSDFSYNPGSDTTKDESSSDRLGNLKYFGRETHTIYPPKLEVVWDDSSWSTGSLSPLVTADLERLKIYFKNLREEYKEGSKVKFRVVGRELYPTTAFATTPAELTAKYLPSASVFYEVKDADTEETIIPFGTGSKVSCDSTGNFFNLWLDGLQAERNYRFCIKVVSGSGTTETINYYDDDYEFRVVR